MRIAGKRNSLSDDYKEYTNNFKNVKSTIINSTIPRTNIINTLRGWSGNIQDTYFIDNGLRLSQLIYLLENGYSTINSGVLILYTCRGLSSNINDSKKTGELLRTHSKKTDSNIGDILDLYQKDPYKNHYFNKAKKISQIYGKHIDNKYSIIDKVISAKKTEQFKKEYPEKDTLFTSGKQDLIDIQQGLNDIVTNNIDIDLTNILFYKDKFKKYKFTNCDFSNSQFVQTQFIECTFDKCKFINITVDDTSNTFIECSGL